MNSKEEMQDLALELYKLRHDPAMVKMVRFLKKRAELWLLSLGASNDLDDIRLLQGAYRETTGLLEAIIEGPPEQETEIEGLDGSYTTSPE